MEDGADGASVMVSRETVVSAVDVGSVAEVGYIMSLVEVVVGTEMLYRWQVVGESKQTRMMKQTYIIVTVR